MNKIIDNWKQNNDTLLNEILLKSKKLFSNDVLIEYDINRSMYYRILTAINYFESENCENAKFSHEFSHATNKNIYNKRSKNMNNDMGNELIPKHKYNQKEEKEEKEESNEKEENDEKDEIVIFCMKNNNHNFWSYLLATRVITDRIALFNNSDASFFFCVATICSPKSSSSSGISANFLTNSSKAATFSGP